MARGSISNNINANELVSGIGQNKKLDLAAIERDEEALQKIRANVRSRYAKKNIKDETALRKAEEDAISKYEQQKNKQTFADRKKHWDEELKYAQGVGQKLSTSFKAIGAGLVSSLGTAAANTLRNVSSGLSSGIEQYLGSYSQYMSGIETRLQGATRGFSDITRTISSNIGASQYVSQTKVLQNLSQLVEQGINYNVEQRAFLATVSDKIATTFDAFNSNLANIIRIQQADSTAARLGLESQLTKFFNSTFGDTSYLSQMFDTVSASLLGAESQLGRDRSVEFEYTVQKWLGSLSSVGVSSSTIQQLAQGLNYLGTGDITSLSANTQLQNLLVMAAQRAGIDYAGVLTGGLTSETANELLRSVVQYGQEIASTSNQVVKSQYANLFGLTISDMTALLNLSSQDLLSISSNMLNYSQMVAETESQIVSIGSRMTLKDRIDTMFENVMASVGEGIANSASQYTTWILADLVEKATGGIAIPTVGALGNFVDLNTTVTGLIKTGIVGYNVISELGTILSGLSGKNQLSLDNWGAQEYLRKGWGFTGISATGVTRTSSEAMFIGSTSESDIYQGSVAAAQESAKETVQGEDTSADQMKDTINNIIPNYLFDIVTMLRSITTTAKMSFSFSSEENPGGI